MTQSVTPRMLLSDDTLVEVGAEQRFRIAHGVHRGTTEVRLDAPVVLIHGTPSSSIIWRNVLPRLTAAGHDVHVFDLLGYGASERPWSEEVDVSVSGQVAVVLKLMDHWELETAHIVAHDIGGGVAQRLGVLQPERVRSTVLIDACSFDSWPSERTRQQMKNGMDALILADPSSHRRHFEEWLLSAVEDDAAISVGPLSNYLDMISGPVGQASFFQHQVLLYDHRHTSELTGRIHELGRVPVSLIWGEADGWQKPHWAKRLHEAIPGSTLTTVPGAGHFVMEDAPDAVSEAVLVHLQRAAA